ncbi:interferon-induced transmembrane protein 5-like [Amia ocellicauda]|uniref:interferon-induced transmembrane protein 5-like n=1 Tax=Amia ocellicauda TaxID=2972642 RepID=UPI0034644ED7
MDNTTYTCPSDYTPLSTSKPAEKPANSTVINMGPNAKPPKDYLIWSLCNTLYVNFCCLGFFALVYSVKARDQKVLGDLRAARDYSNKAKWYNILASGWNIIIPLLIIVLFVTGIVHLANVRGSYDFFGDEGYDNFMRLFRR